MTIAPVHFVLAAVAALVVWTLLRWRGDVSSAEARRLVADGARLLDVRTTGEFAAGHLEGALNIPVAELSARLGKVGPKERPVVVYCASGARSAAAARMLRAGGWRVVRNLGGMSRW